MPRISAGPARPFSPVVVPRLYRVVDMLAERTPQHPDVEIAKIASRQHGVFHRRQALAAGFTVSAITRKLASGRWVRMYEAVYSLAGVPLDHLSELMGSCLWGGSNAVASYRSAGQIGGILETNRLWLEITIPGPRRSPNDRLIVHKSAVVGPDRATHKGIPVTDPTRTLLDLAQVLAEEELDRALDRALFRGLTSIPRLLWRIDNLGKRSGSKRLRLLLLERDPTTAPTESDLEEGIYRLLVSSDIANPMRQHPVGRWRIDLAYPDRMLAIECDGYATHSGKRDWQNDLERQNYLINLGWRVLRFTWDDLVYRPQWIIETVRTALAQ